MTELFIQPNWPAPKTIKAFTTLRASGNLANHVGDDPARVAANRESLKKNLNLPNEPIWIQQTHSTIALEACDQNKKKEADATFTHQPNHICAVLTADCLPLLVCHQSGSHVAAIHAGWRGLANGVIEAALQKLSLKNDELLVWLGPAMGPQYYEVGDEVRELFLQNDPKAMNGFTPSTNPNKWLANLYTLARNRLERLGVEAIYGGEFCTYADPKRFFSYRREGANTGRMASLIWINE